MDDNSQLQNIIDAIYEGRNIILHGPGGTGKTYTLCKVSKFIRSMSKKFACTATTGIAALNLNIPEEKIYARTLHSWAGIGLAQGCAQTLLAKVRADKRCVKRWMETDVLIIDEVSMLGAGLIDKLDFIAKSMRGNFNKAFGGLQIIFSGDFLQLPPVKDDWAFRSEAWKELNLKMFKFEDPKRYDDEEYFELLLRIRNGTCTKKDMNKLKGRHEAYKRLQEILSVRESTKIIKPTVVFSKRLDVETYNQTELNKLPGEITMFTAQDDLKCKRADITTAEYYKKVLDDAIPREVPLKVGAQVMLKYNLDVANGLVNGSRGVVVKIDGGVVTVKFVNGEKIDISENTWKHEDKKGSATRSQIPLILAWAVTIHKCQGLTLDYATCDLGPSIFAAGQSYVGLSRVRNFKGLFVSDFYMPSIKVSKIALAYVNSM